jgi:hypothetical protein
MPSIPLFYTVIDNTGNIVFSQITQDPEYPVEEGQRLVADQIPDYDSTGKTIVRITPVPDGQDYIEYQIVDIVYDTEEAIANLLRTRNGMLEVCDWTQLPDVPLTPTQVDAWKVYRQALRDVTDQTGYPSNIIWPTQPE